MMMSERLLAAIAHVSGDCAGEIETEEDESFSEILAETVIDANRITIWGYPEEDAEMHRLIRAHGYPAVLAEVAKHVIY